MGTIPGWYVGGAVLPATKVPPPVVGGRREGAAPVDHLCSSATSGTEHLGSAGHLGNVEHVGRDHLDTSGTVTVAAESR